MNRQIALLGCMAMVFAASVGCNLDMNGQTLPSPYWLADDVQYFPAGPEFKLAREAAAMGAAEVQPGYGNPPPGAMPGGAGGAIPPVPGPMALPGVQ